MVVLFRLIFAAVVAITPVFEVVLFLLVVAVAAVVTFVFVVLLLCCYSWFCYSYCC